MGRSQGFGFASLVPNFFVQKLKEKKGRRKRLSLYDTDNSAGQSNSFDFSSQSKVVLLDKTQSPLCSRQQPQDRKDGRQELVNDRHEPAKIKSLVLSVQRETPTSKTRNLNTLSNTGTPKFVAGDAPGCCSFKPSALPFVRGAGILPEDVPVKKVAGPVFGRCLPRSKMKYSLTLSDSDAEETDGNHLYASAHTSRATSHSNENGSSELAKRAEIDSSRSKTTKDRRTRVQSLPSNLPPPFTAKDAPVLATTGSELDRSACPDAVFKGESPAYFSSRKLSFDADTLNMSISSDEESSNAVAGHSLQQRRPGPLPIRWRSKKSTLESDVKVGGSPRNRSVPATNLEKNRTARFESNSFSLRVPEMFRASEERPEIQDESLATQSRFRDPSADSKEKLYGASPKLYSDQRGHAVSQRQSSQPRIDLHRDGRIGSDFHQTAEQDSFSKAHHQRSASSTLPRPMGMYSEEYQKVVFGGSMDMDRDMNFHLDTAFSRNASKSVTIHHADSYLAENRNPVKSNFGFAAVPLRYFIKRNPNSESPVYEECKSRLPLGDYDNNSDYYKGYRSPVFSETFEQETYPYSKMWDSEFPSFRSESNTPRSRRGLCSNGEKGNTRIETSDSEAPSPRSTRFSRTGDISESESCTSRSRFSRYSSFERIPGSNDYGTGMDSSNRRDWQHEEDYEDDVVSRKLRPTHSVRSYRSGLEQDSRNNSRESSPCFEAVVKSSCDPYMDFRESMVEMIVERGIAKPEEFEDLLQCYLSLNSADNHTLIVQVFSDLWQAIFDPEETKL